MCKLAFTLALLGAFWLVPSAQATTQTAQSGPVSASFTFTGHYPSYSGERLQISQSGTVLYDQPVVSSLCASQCAPGAPSPQQPSVHVLDLEHTGQPDVLLDLFSGGAHCCSIEQVFSFDPGTMTYVKTERDFGDPGEEIVDLGHNGRYEFLTADDSFAYEFTDFAASGLPIQILTFANRRFTDVTRSYPRLVAKDAARWRRVFRSLGHDHYADSVGVAAAWAADEALLGHVRLVNRFLASQARAGHLNAATGQAG
ncbi:MAG: hypothetical protein JO244_13300, partial [Solirubrobacterales bacterium]|nr:hypothetical protein [Solirubrobacterales bacterium]